jgi:hypothetical protein
MKAYILVVLIALSGITMFSGCEKPDYQHPMHRK